MQALTLQDRRHITSGIARSPIAISVCFHGERMCVGAGRLWKILLSIGAMGKEKLGIGWADSGA
jgi:hypothetical protein